MANQGDELFEEKRQLLFGIAHRILGDISSQMGAGQQDDTTFPNFLTDLLPTSGHEQNLRARVECLSVLIMCRKSRFNLRLLLS